MADHRDLTGADLHEPKGADTASANSVYVADGSGSGTWAQVGATSIDPSSVKNLNREQMFGAYIDIGTAGSRYLAFAKSCTIVKVLVVVQSATGGSATILTFRNAAGSSMGTVTVPSSAAPGDVFSLVPVANNSFVADTRLQVDSDGGTSTNTNVQFTFELTWN
jgi:hypothetical protein